MAATGPSKPQVDIKVDSFIVISLKLLAKSVTRWKAAGYESRPQVSE
jgi:hypothetical protein